MRLNNIRGFTLVETLVGAFLFIVISLGIYQSFITAGKLVGVSKIKTEAALLAEEQFELVHNLPYDQIGLQGGIPAGALPRFQTFVRSGVTFNATTTIRNIDDSFDGTIGGSPNDTAPADYKQVAITISCANCSLATPFVFTTTAAPKNLENTGSSGAIFITVIDASGTPLPDASIHVANASSTPPVSIDETTNENGQLQLVGVPPGANAYSVTVTKSGYSADGTTPITQDNPNPTNPPLTVATAQVTAKTFIIDRVGDLQISTASNTCAPIGGVSLTITGKLIGTSPTVYKYNQTATTNGSGQLNLPNLEWDNYDLKVNGTSYDLAGSAPFLPVPLLPSATQEVNLVLAAHNPKALLTIVQDAVTGLPVPGATVTLKKGTSYTKVGTTDRGSFIQTDWSGGSGQELWTDLTKYSSDDGNVDTVSSAGNVTLRKTTGNKYVTSGTLVSSAFDTGDDSATTYYSLTWTPQSQPSQTGTNSVKFQIATATSSNASTTWNFVGPDGSSASYFTTTNGNINAAQATKRYVRYKLYLSTTNTNYTPTLSDVSLTYGNGCLPFSQVFFSGLSAGTHTLTVTKAGYQTYSNTAIPITADWQKFIVPLQPS